MSLKRDTASTKRAATPIWLIAMNLKKQLRFYLDRNNMTAAQLAKKAGVPKQSLSGWLAGSNPRDVRQIKQVADIFGISLDNLMFGEGPDRASERITELDALLGEDWISGLFEVRFRRVKKARGDRE